MQSIGLSVEEIAIVYLALPLTTFLAPPVSGTYNHISGYITIGATILEIRPLYKISVIKHNSQ